eukprot:15393365-Alexandrium_andersonii.AAC.1
MSASLVGSEMCIRDRSRGVVAPLREGGAEAANSEVKALKALLQRCTRCCPVSYTHLTLPTICSV